MPTFPVFNASPAGRAAPQKLAYHEIARSAVDTAGDKESPRNRSRRGTRPHPPSRASFISSHPGHGPGGFVQRSSYRILCKWCTNEKPPPVNGTRITITNHYYLEEVGFDPQNPAKPAPQPRPVCIPDASLPETKPPRLRFPILRPNRESVFSLHPRGAPPRRLTHKGAQTQNRCTWRSPDN